jgi:hypothetical protein
MKIEIPQNQETTTPNKRSLGAAVLRRASQHLRQANCCLLGGLGSFHSRYPIFPNLDEQSLDVDRCSCFRLRVFNHDVASDRCWYARNLRGNFDLLRCYCDFLGEPAEFRHLRHDYGYQWSQGGVRESISFTGCQFPTEFLLGCSGFQTCVSSSNT